MRVLQFSGAGRLHFVESASALMALGVDVRVCMGLVASERFSGLLDAFGRLIKRKQLSKRLLMRHGVDDGLRARVYSNGLGEAAVVASSILNSYVSPERGYLERIGWAVSGCLAQRWAGDAHVLHVRSGSGGGGLIESARRCAKFVIADHSIAHPSELDRTLSAAAGTIGVSQPISLGNAFWRRVLEDCESANLVVVNSDYVKETFVQRGWDRRSVVVNYWGVPETFVSLKQDWRTSEEIRLLFTGTFGLRKGAGVLLEALDAINSARQRCVLDVVGDASEAIKLWPEQVKRPWIRLHGPVLPNELERFLRDADCYVFPSYAEGCARSAMEALVAGVPVIATTETGLPSSCEQTYVTIPAGNAGALVNALERMMCNEQMRRSLGLAGIAIGRSEEFSWRAYARRMLRIYEEGLHTSQCWLERATG